MEHMVISSLRVKQLLKSIYTYCCACFVPFPVCQHHQTLTGNACPFCKEGSSTDTAISGCHLKLW